MNCKKYTQQDYLILFCNTKYYNYIFMYTLVT